MKLRLLLGSTARAGCSLICALTVLLFPAWCFAQTPTIYTDVDKLIRSGEEVKALGSDLFGEKINMYNGAVEFIQTDVSLPGNNALAVSVGRRLTAGHQTNPQGLFGDWDLEIPHLHGIFANAGSSGTSPAPAGCGAFVAPAGVNYQGGNFNADEFWYGSFVSIPGLGTEEILARNSGGSPAPTDGSSWPLVTRSLWAISCFSGGYIVATPDGNRYRFNWPVTRPYPTLEKATPLPERSAGARGVRGDSSQPAGQSVAPTPEVADGYILPRVERWILPTQVTDRFGNTVNYNYDSSRPWRLLSIVASDGRRLDLNYPNNSDTVSSVSDGQRTWTYSYVPGPYFLSLSQILQPDNSVWRFSMASLSPGATLYAATSVECDSTGYSGSDIDVGSMTHPSGATGSFSIRTVSHPRSFVPRSCRGGQAGDPSTQWAYYPKYISNKALVSKTISGPGLTPESWAYAYSTIDSASWNTCSGNCPDWLTTEVTDPRGVLTRYTFGTRFQVNEGQLQKVEVIASGNTYRTATMTYRAPDAGPYAVSIGQSFQKRGNGDLASRFTPQDRKATHQQGVDFVWQADGSSFDSMARPHTVSRSSSLGYSRAETTAFYDRTGLWVLGQTASVTENSTGKVMVANVYDPINANLLNKSSFGRLESRFTYNTDGTLATKSDGLNQTTTFSNYKRGIAQNVLYADNTTVAGVVDDLGLIRSVTAAHPVGEAGTSTTTLGYDAIGRLNLVTYPTADTVAWNSTSLIFEPMSVSEYGLEPGHWRQRVITGQGITETYFDALWRPRLTRSYDASLPAATSKMVTRRFDSDNRKTFESYPARSIGLVSDGIDGISTEYEPLGRAHRVVAASELGPLATTTDYLDGFRKQVTSPKGQITSTAFQAFDEPSENAIAAISAPETLNVVINRDLFGKPTAITRSGTYAGQPVSATRSYVYDPYPNGELLCKTVEPETGATIDLHDAAGNLYWRAAGLALTSLSSCDYASVPAGAKTTFGYDVRNQLKNTSYGDGSPGIFRTLTPDGLPGTVVSGSSTWTYQYNKRRLVENETLTVPGQSFHIGKSYDPYGHLAQLTYPDNTVLNHDVNALGEVTRVWNPTTSYASNITYWPNGSVAGYTLGNGIVHTLTQNARQLPLASSDSGIFTDQYTYDANGNTASITDVQEGINTRTMTYDGLDRLSTANAPNVWDTGSYTYDALDNIRTSAVGSRNSLHVYDSQNRLSYIRNASGDTDYTYDDHGNITGKGGQGYYFDQGNRMQLATGKASYTYDGFGRRTSVVPVGAATMFWVYDSTGQMLFERTMPPPPGVRSLRDSRSTTGRYIYLGGKLIAETYSDIGTNYVHTDALGSPVARTNVTTTPGARTRYEPYGNTAAGPVPSPIGFTGHVNDVDTGLVYMQQRYYDSVAGRFLSVDPVVTDAETGTAFNVYNYAQNNPYRYTDPDGRLSCAGQTGGCEIINFVSTVARTFIAAAPAPAVVVGAILLLTPGNIGQDAHDTVAGTPLEGHIKQEANSEDTDKDTTKRPSRVRTGTEQANWDSAADGANGSKVCPTCGNEVSSKPGEKGKDWDNDHVVPWRARDLTGKDRKGVLDEYNRDTRLRCVGCNRSDNGK